MHQSIPVERLGEGIDAHYVKAFTDGTLGSRTARLLDGSGVQITSREQLEEIIERAARHRLPVAPEDVPRFASIGVAASVQYAHATSDRELAARIWADRLDHAYPYRQLLAAGALLAGGSDAPVEELDPLAGLQAAVEQIPIEAALASFTTAPAWLSGHEDRRGRIAAGFDADLVVLDRDPVTSAAEDLAGLEVLGTMVAGEWVYRR